jgi:hypothetical protein
MNELFTEFKNTGLGVIRLKFDPITSNFFCSVFLRQCLAM